MRAHLGGREADGDALGLRHKVVVARRRLADRHLEVGDVALAQHSVLVVAHGAQRGVRRGGQRRVAADGAVATELADEPRRELVDDTGSGRHADPANPADHAGPADLVRAAIRLPLQQVAHVARWDARERQLLEKKLVRDVPVPQRRELCERRRTAAHARK